MLCFAGLFLVGLDVFVWFVLGFVCSDLSSGVCFLWCLLEISLSCLLGVACLGDFSSVWLVCLDVFVDLGVNLVVGCCLFGLIWCLLLVGWFWVAL